MSIKNKNNKKHIAKCYNVKIGTYRLTTMLDDELVELISEYFAISRIENAIALVEFTINDDGIIYYSQFPQSRKYQKLIDIVVSALEIRNVVYRNVKNFSLTL